MKLLGVDGSEGSRGLATLPLLILLATAVQVAGGILSVGAWYATGNDIWVRIYFRDEGALFLLGTSGLTLGLCLKSWRQFSPGDPLRAAWLLFTCAAACHVVGTVCVQLLGARAYLNPLLIHEAGVSQAVLDDFRWLGLTVSGPLRWPLIAVGLFLVLRVYRRSGLLPKLKWTDQVLIALLTAYALLEARGVFAAIEFGKKFPLREKIAWLNDPLLLVLLLEAIVIRRSIRAAGLGLVGRCWGAFVAAIALTCAGDLGLWAHAYGYLPWQADVITWNIWFLSAAAYAMGPAYQMAATQRIRRELGRITLRRAQTAYLRATG